MAEEEPSKENGSNQSRRRSRKSDSPRKFECDMTAAVSVVVPAVEEVHEEDSPASNRRKSKIPIRFIRATTLRSGRACKNVEMPKKDNGAPRPRGRPRKSEEKPAKGSRPRGRPRKNEKKATKGKSGRRPGRPRKIVDEARTPLIIVVDPEFKSMFHSIVDRSEECRRFAHRCDERRGSAHVSQAA